MTANTANILRDYVDAWNAHDAERVVKFLADNYVYKDMSFGTKKCNQKEFAASIAGSLKCYPNQRKVVKSIFGTKSRACMRWTWSGTDDFLRETLHSSGVTIFRVSKDKISRESCYQNMGDVVNFTGSNLIIIGGILEEEQFECPEKQAILRIIARNLGKLDHPGPKIYKKQY